MALYEGQSPAVFNYVTNPSGEVNTTGWTGSTTGTVPTSSFAVSATAAWVGLQSFKQSVSGANTSGSSRIDALIIQTVYAGQSYSFGARTLKSHLNFSPTLVVEWYSGANATGTLLQTDSTVLSHYAANLVNWKVLKLEGMLAPATAISAKVKIVGTLGAASVTGDIYWDGIQFNDGEKLDAYIDGSQGSGYSWIGPAHNATSKRNAFTFSTAIVRDGIIKVFPELYLTDRYNNLGDSLSDYSLSALVEMRTDRAIKMVLKGTLKEGAPVDPFTSYLAPFITLIYPDGTEVNSQLGVYSILPPTVDSTVIASLTTYEGRDLAWNLSQTTFDTPYVVAAGANLIGAATAILAGEGYVNTNIPSSTKTATAALTFPITQSKLDIINDLLNAVGYYTLWFNEVGIPTSFPYLDYGTVNPAVTYASGLGSSVYGTIRREKTTDTLCNKVRVIKEDSSNVANPIVVTLYNRNPLSPVSTVKLNRVIYKEIKDSKIADSATATAIAQRALREAAAIYTKYTITTAIDPLRRVNEVYQGNVYQDDGTPILLGRFWCSGWDMPLAYNGVMTHYLNRSEEYL